MAIGAEGRDDLPGGGVGFEQLDSYRERGEAFRRQLRQAEKQLRESGEDQLEDR